MSQLEENNVSRSDLCRYIDSMHRCFIDLFNYDHEKLSLQNEYHRIANSKPPNQNDYTVESPDYPDRPSIGWKIVWIFLMLFGILVLIPATSININMVKDGHYTLSEALGDEFLCVLLCSAFILPLFCI